MFWKRKPKVEIQRISQRRLDRTAKTLQRHFKAVGRWATDTLGDDCTPFMASYIQAMSLIATLRERDVTHIYLEMKGDTLSLKRDDEVYPDNG